jgi:hypothetical protein
MVLPLQVDFGVISQTSFAFSAIFNALTIIVNRFGELSGLAAQVCFLRALFPKSH